MLMEGQLPRAGARILLGQGDAPKSWSISMRLTSSNRLPLKPPVLTNISASPFGCLDKDPNLIDRVAVLRFQVPRNDCMIISYATVFIINNKL
jgi:hypothetical protein